MMLLFLFIFGIIGSALFFTLGENLVPKGAFPKILGYSAKTAGDLILFFGGTIIFLFLLIWLIVFTINRIREDRIKKLLRNGDLKDAVVVSNTQNFYIKVNGVPQRIVSFKVDDIIYEYRFFNEPWAAHFPVGLSIKIRCSEKGKALPDTSFFVS